ncbi:flagellin [Opitutales bacterium]|nr:flagellin [Opitutales bacterium]
MSFTINTNVSARIAGLYSARADSALGKSVTRLSSGKKLLSPADDAGGLAVALKIDSQRARIEASTLNAQNAISYLQVQDGVLQSIGSILDRFGELRTMAQDATKNSSDIGNYNQEFMELQLQYDSISDERFNGVSLFAGDADSTVDLQPDALVDNHSQFGGLSITFDKFSRNLVLHPSGDPESGSVSISMVNLDYVMAINWNAIDPDDLTIQPDGQELINNLLALSIGQITNALEKLASVRAENGAEQNAVRNHHELLRSNLAALENAHGRIMDADIAVESGQLAKQNVIRESSVSMQVQANRLIYLGLTLIGAG